MSTQLRKIAAKAKQDPKARFTSLAHLLTPEFLRDTWRQLNRKGASGIDGETIQEFETNLEDRIQDLWRRLRAGQYHAPAVRRVEIPKGNGKTRPLGIPTVEDRLLQRAVARIVSAIYEPDFLDCSFGYRPGRNPHMALKALRDHIVTGKVRHVYEADIQGYFTHLNHEWLRKMIALRIADPVISGLIGKWLNAGVMEHGVIARPEAGTPQGGPISPCLANVYLHYVLDLWFERKAKPRLRGEAYLVRYIDDFVVCFQFREDALRLQEALRKRLGKFGLTLEPTKTKLVEFGRFAHRHASRHGRKRPETIYFLGFTLYCTRNLKGNFKVGMRTEKSRLRRSLMSLCDQMRQTRHLPIQEQVDALNLTLRGHYAYYGVAGNIRALQRVHRFVERYWRKMLCSRSWAGRHLTWAAFNRLKERVPLLRPRLRLPYRALQALVVL